jgi:hypothetical protein
LGFLRAGELSELLELGKQLAGIAQELGDVGPDRPF